MKTIDFKEQYMLNDSLYSVPEKAKCDYIRIRIKLITLTKLFFANRLIISRIFVKFNVIFNY